MRGHCVNILGSGAELGRIVQDFLAADIRDDACSNESNRKASRREYPLATSSRRGAAPECVGSGLIWG